MYIGTAMVLLDVGSFLLNRVNYEFELLAWVDHRGPTAGMAIRVDCIVIGVLLWLIYAKLASDPDA